MFWFALNGCVCELCTGLTGTQVQPGRDGMSVAQGSRAWAEAAGWVEVTGDKCSCRARSCIAVTEALQSPVPGVTPAFL